MLLLLLLLSLLLLLLLFRRIKQNIGLDRFIVVSFAAKYVMSSESSLSLVQTKIQLK